MPIVKTITSARVINSFSGTPDGTKFLRDDGTLVAVSGYSKLLASGTNDGTLTLYDDTATTGRTLFEIREGESDVNSGNYLLRFLSFGGSNRGGVVAGINDINFRADRYDDLQNNNFSLVAANGLYMIDTLGIRWANGSYYNTAHTGLMVASSGVLKVSDGSTGIGSILSSWYVQAKAADYTVAVTDSSSVFTNEGTTTKNNFSLPTAAANLVYTFVVQDTDGLTVTANTGDTIQDNATVSGSAGTIDSTDVGATVTLLAINATQWVVTSMTGTWAIT